MRTGHLYASQDPWFVIFFSIFNPSFADLDQDDFTLDNWERVIRINLTGVWLSMKYEIQQMLRQGGGAIVNMASMEGLIAFPGVSPYVAAKHGVNGITKTAALEC